MVLGLGKGVSDQPRYSVQYAVTLTLNPKLYKYEISDQYDKTRELVRDCPFKVTCIAESTSQYNLHYHCVMSVKLPVKDARKAIFDWHRKLLKEFGKQMVVKQIDDYQGWVDYLSKDLRKSSETLGRPPILRDDHGIFPLGMFPLYSACV